MFFLACYVNPVTSVLCDLGSARVVNIPSEFCHQQFSLNHALRIMINFITFFMKTLMTQSNDQD